MADITVNLEEEEKEALLNLPTAVTETIQAGMEETADAPEPVVLEQPEEASKPSLFDLPHADELDKEDQVKPNLYDLPPSDELSSTPVETADPAFGVPYERTSDELPTRSEFVSWGRIQEDVDPDTLKDNADWVIASSLLFKTTYGADVLGRNGEVPPHIMDILNDYGDDDDSLETKLANYGLEEMASFNWNIGSMGIDAANLSALGDNEEDLEAKWAFVYLLDQYENVNNSWQTTWNSTKALATDPTIYAGLGSWGIGTVISQGARVVGKKEAVKLIKAAVRKGLRASALKAGLNTQKKRLGAFAFAEGAVHTGAFTHIDQKVRLETEADYFQLDKEETEQYLDENYSALKTTGMSAVGGTLALGGSIALSKVIEKWASKRAAKRLDAQQEAYEKEILEQLDEATQMLNDHQTTVITRMMENDEPLEDILEALAQMDIAKTVDNAADDTFEEVIEEIVEEVEFVAPKLPRSLSGSKPTYNYGSFNVKLNFEDDIAKALYIVGSKTKSKNYAQFMAFLQKAGVKNIQQRAAAMRNSIKKQAADGADSVDVTYNKPKTVKRTTQKVTQKEKVQAAGAKSDPRPKVDAGKVPNFMKKTVELLKMVKDNPDAAVSNILQQLDKMSYRMIEISEVKSMVNEANMVAQHQLLQAEAKLVNKTLTDEQRAVLIEEVMDAQKIADNMTEMKEHMNAYSGRDLQDIQNWILYKTEKGKAPSKEAIAEAHLNWYNNQYRKIVNERTPEVEELLNTGKFEEALDVINKSEQSDEVQAIYKGIEKYDPEQAAKLRNDPQANASLMDKTSEIAIASMFNMTTIQYNTVIPLLKTFTMPLLDTLAQNPLSLNAWRKTMYQYSVMSAYNTHAVNAWRLAQHLEHTSLTADPARFYDGGVKNKGGFWQMWRIMTRMVAGSDAYLSELIASSYMSAKAYDEIVTEAVEQGLKGEELKNAINIDAIFNRMKKGYDTHLTEQKLKPIIEKANSLNLKGEKKEAYILATLKAAAKTDGLKTLTDEGAYDLVQSMLYKKKLKRVYRDDSGKAHWENQFRTNPVRHMGERFESGAAAWEELMKTRPLARLILTPFWRTPVWLVNEAIRLSPFLQQMHPTMMDDLAGVNGMARQARAQTEAMVAHAWLMYTTVKYAQGEITGTGDIDFTKRMQQTNSGVGLPPHVIEWDEGEGMSYLRAEPIRLPTQLWIDTLNNYRQRVKKQGMGGYGNEMDLQEEFMADMSVVLGSLLTSIKDTQLTQGISDLVKAGGDTFSTLREEADSTEGVEPAMKYIAKKTMMVVPAQIRKTQQAFGADEKTRAFDAKDRFIQMFQPNHESIPREYDWRFKPMKMQDPEIAIWGFSTHDYYESDWSDEEKEIDQYFRMLEQNDIAHVSRHWFKAPKYFGNEDLRNLDIEYVTESGAVRTQHIYALVHQEAAKMNKNGAYTRQLLNIIRSNSPLGTPDGDLDSAKIADLKQAMSTFKDKAMTKLLSNPRYAEAKKLAIQTRYEKQDDAMRN